MQWRWWVLPWLVVAGLAAGGCFGVRPEPPQPTSMVADDRAPIEWARDEPFLVVARLGCRTVSVYRHGEWDRTYEQVSFGREPGVKLYQGDRKTPRGLYKIVGRRVHPRWSRFLLLDYPNLNDREAHRAAFAEGRAASSPGGEVGIHGSDEPILNRTSVDWTLGCISLLDEDVRDLYQLVPNGTLVLIED